MLEQMPSVLSQVEGLPGKHTEDGSRSLCTGRAERPCRAGTPGRCWDGTDEDGTNTASVVWQRAALLSGNHRATLKL